MAKIKDAKRSILQIMPVMPVGEYKGYVAIVEDDKKPGSTVRIPLFAWALVRKLDGKTVHTQITGVFLNNEGQVTEACWCVGFVKYETA